MNGGKEKYASGFTLMEVAVASAITIIVMSSFMAVFIHAMKVWQQEEIKNELNQNLEEAMEKIRQDLRLSSIGVGLMSFYASSGGQYTAISLPMADDTDNDGLLDRDNDDKIIWNQTVVYHVRPGTPDKLMRTVFAPRYTNSTPADIYSQLSAVVAATADSDVVSAKLTGETCTSKVVFENLVQLTFYAPNATYDCYSGTVSRANNYNWGSLVLSGGTHQLTFTITNKNVSSSGYKFMLDAVRLSASGSVRDGELFSSPNTHPVSPFYSYSNTIATNVSGQYMGPDWIGQSALILSGTSTGSITLNVDNDLWCDNNFNDPSYVEAVNCRVDIATNLSPADVVVVPDKGMTWGAVDSGTQNGATNLASFSIVTNYVYGTNSTLGSLKQDGCWARFYFERETNMASYSLLISNATVSTESGSIISNITFGGSNAVMLYPESTNVAVSDWVPMWEIYKGSNYLVKFESGETGDLDHDMVVGNMSSGSRVAACANSGTPTIPIFGATINDAWINTGGAGTPAPCLVDLDADGDFDIAVAGGAGGLRWYKNIGTSRSPLPQYAGMLTGDCGCTDAKAAFADLDGNGVLDCVLAHYHTATIYYYKNTGTAKSPNFVYAGILASGLPSAYLAPEFCDIDGDGWFEMFAGNGANGNLYYWDNNQTTNPPSFNLVTVAYLAVPHTSLRAIPRFVDINNDGKYDLFLGAGQGGVAPDGEIWYYENIGTPAAAAWAAPVTNLTFTGGYACPSFANLDGAVGSYGNGPAKWDGSAGDLLSTINGSSLSSLIGLSQIEVGYPRFARFRSGIFDTTKAAPVYTELNWTEDVNASGDVYVRARFSNIADMSDVGESDWVGESGSTNYFQNNSGNAIPSGNSFRYVQYEAKLEVGKGGNTWAHTNDTPPMLRDVTINWPAAAGLVDLRTDLGRGPDCGIVSVMVDGNPLVKGIQAQMQIYKEGRTGTNYASGIIEVKPLNTGK